MGSDCFRSWSLLIFLSSSWKAKCKETFGCFKFLRLLPSYSICNISLDESKWKAWYGTFTPFSTVFQWFVCNEAPFMFWRISHQGDLCPDSNPGPHDEMLLTAWPCGLIHKRKNNIVHVQASFPKGKTENQQKKLHLFLEKIRLCKVHLQGKNVGSSIKSF